MTHELGGWVVCPVPVVGGYQERGTGQRAPNALPGPQPSPRGASHRAKWVT